MESNEVVNTADSITEEIKAFTAGFFDAEGTVSINKNYSLYTEIAQTYKPVLVRIQKFFRGTITNKKPYNPSKNEGWKKAYRWFTFANETLSFLESIYPYSIEKRQQIKLAIEFQKTKLSLTEEQKEWYINELKRLKHENYGEKELKNCENEIKKLSIPKDIRNGKQQTIFGLDNLYRTIGIDSNKETTDDRYYIPNIPENFMIIYLSGFFDGEGCIRICIDKSQKKKGNRLHIKLGNSNFDILKIYNDKFGGKIYNHSRKDKKDYYKKFYNLQISGNNTLSFLKQIQNYTIVKREQVDVAIEFQEWHNQIGPIITLEQKQKAESYANRLKELKKMTGEDDTEFDNELCDIRSVVIDKGQTKLDFTLDMKE